MANTLVVGGISEGEGKDAIFVEKRRYVVDNKNIGNIFRRDYILAGMQLVKLSNTNEPITPGLTFACTDKDNWT